MIIYTCVCFEKYKAFYKQKGITVISGRLGQKGTLGAEHDMHRGHWAVTKNGPADP